jgi:hypothetical protein
MYALSCTARASASTCVRAYSNFHEGRGLAYHPGAPNHNCVRVGQQDPRGSSSIVPCVAWGWVMGSAALCCVVGACKLVLVQMMCSAEVQRVRGSHHTHPRVQTYKHAHACTHTHKWIHTRTRVHHCGCAGAVPTTATSCIFWRTPQDRLCLRKEPSQSTTTCCVCLCSLAQTRA